jgi:hypothetical protein
MRAVKERGNRLVPTLSVRRSARSTQVVRFRLWIRSYDGSGSFRFNFLTTPGENGEAQ